MTLLMKTDSLSSKHKERSLLQSLYGSFLQQGGVAKVMSHHDGRIQGGEVQGGDGDAVVSTPKTNKHRSVWNEHTDEEVVPKHVSVGEPNGSSGVSLAQLCDLQTCILKSKTKMWDIKSFLKKKKNTLALLEPFEQQNRFLLIKKKLTICP